MGDSGTHLDEFLVSERGGLTPGLGISVGFTAFEIFGVLAGTGDAGTADSAKEGLSLGGGAAVVEVARLGEIGIVEDGAEFSAPSFVPPARLFTLPHPPSVQKLYSG